MPASSAQNQPDPLDPPEVVLDDLADATEPNPSEAIVRKSVRLTRQAGLLRAPRA